MVHYNQLRGNIDSVNSIGWKLEDPELNFNFTNRGEQFLNLSMAHFELFNKVNSSIIGYKLL